MKKLLLAAVAAIACLAAPAANAQTTPQYWGGPMGKDLPGATMTFKLVDGRVKQLQAEVRVHCRAEGGGPAPNSRLIDFHGPIDIDSGYFENTKNNFFDGGTGKVAGTFTSTSSATGFYKARYRLDDMRHDYVRVCHTGKQDWTAAPLSKDEWKALRDYG